MKRPAALLLIALVFTSPVWAQHVTIRPFNRNVPKDLEDVLADTPSDRNAGKGKASAARRSGQNDAASKALAAIRSVESELKTDGRIAPATARSASEALSPRRVNARKIGRGQVLDYYRIATMAHLAAGKFDLAGKAVIAWVSKAPGDPRALQSKWLLASLTGKQAMARAALKELRKPAYKDGKAWAMAKGRYLKLVGSKPAIELPLTNGETLTPGDVPGKMVVLYFWQLAAKTPATRGGKPVSSLTHMMQVASTCQQMPVHFIGVNLDSGETATQAGERIAETIAAPEQVLGADEPGAGVAKALGVRDPGTAVVFAGDGRVLYAGACDDWQAYAAISAGSAHLGFVPRGKEDPEQERQAKALYDEGWKLWRLGRKTHNPLHRKQGVDLMHRVVKEYPDTAAADRARDDLDFMDK